MIKQERIRPLNTVEYRSGSILCALGRDIRAHDNDALLYAHSLAVKHSVPLFISITIWPTFIGATSRYYTFFYESLKETEKTLRSLNIPVILLFGNEDVELELFIKKNNVGFLVTDFLPLRFSKKWKERLLSRISIPMHEVDAHNIVPAWITSNKQEFAARTIRPKLYKLLGEYLDDYEELKKLPNASILSDFPKIDFENIFEKTTMRMITKGSLTGGENVAMHVLNDFLNNKLDSYGEARNDFMRDGQSNLSPYISKGMTSRRRIALATLSQTGLPITVLMKKDTNGSNGTEASASSFLEELIIRAELAENFCFYNDSYDSFEGSAHWAQLTLNKARSDPRVYTYTRSEFEHAETHDELWNAAQNELLQTGKMHGYLRMYWAKKILEWTKSPEDAIAVAIYLNDTYQQDGLDPNGYAGVMWSIAGLHDRAWFGRPIFGAIRYMARSGAEKRGNVVDYIDKWNLKK